MSGAARGPGLDERLDALERAVAIGGHRLDPDDAARAAQVVRRGRERLALSAGSDGLAGSSTVIALAGATGSGKSSLFNAFAGMELSQVGARRPTTSLPSAVVWGEVPDRLLDWLEVPTRHRTRRESALDAHDEDPLHGLVLLDLPDHDSTDVSNRLQVDRLVTLVDLLVFVLDPQKYADAAIHEGYLRPLASHQELLLVVLNQVDTLTEAAAAACEADVRRLLVEDGLDRVHVVRTSARTGEGVAALREIVEGAVAARSASVRRTEADVEAAGRMLAEGVAPSEADLDDAEVDQLVDVLATAAGVPTVLDAVQAQQLRRGRGLTGWPVTRWLGRWRPDPLARLHLARPAERGAGGRGDADPSAALRRLARSSLGSPSPAQRAQVALAARRVAGHAATGLPQRWADAVRAGVRPATDDVTGSLADSLDQAMHTVPLASGPPLWQRAVGVLQALVAAVLVVGLVWTLGWAGAEWLRLPLGEPLRVGAPPLDLPLPWVMTAAAAVTGIVLAALARPGVRWVARRRRRRVEVALRAAVEQVAREQLLAAVADVLADHRATREALAVVTAPGARPRARATVGLRGVGAR